MTRSLLKTIFILPGSALVFIPAVILYAMRNTRFSHEFQSPAEVTFWVAAAVIASGGWLAIRTVRLFLTTGEGTPAPWEPPKKLVITGPYRYVRNPMITGAIIILLGETILFNSWPLFLWMMIFLIGKMIYLRKVEEKELQKRFGAPYNAYMAQVPGWVPRFKRFV